MREWLSGSVVFIDVVFFEGLRSETIVFRDTPAFVVSAKKIDIIGDNVINPK